MIVRSISIPESNISLAWARAFLALMEPGSFQRHPALISISGLSDDVVPERPAIRQLLERELKNRNESSCSTVASTIFPTSMWNPDADRDADLLYERYEKAWPLIKKCRANRYGVYFRRLTSYQPAEGKSEPVNQLKFIATTYKNGNHRKSALQAAVVDPTRDHTNQRQKGFPCMQQVSFTPLEGGALSITGFYATQYQFEKAYGNYLGLYWLGRFMAKQLGLTLTQVVCMAAVLERGKARKAELEELAKSLRTLVDGTSSKNA